MKTTLKTLLILCLFMAVSFALQAQTRVTVGTGTGTDRYPFGAYYGYERSASLYLSSELGQTGDITQLSWYVGSYNSSREIPTKIYLKTTTATALTATTWSNMISGATLVYDNERIFTINGWKVVDMTDFNYTGSNLLVLVETNYGSSGTSGSSTFRYSSLGSW